jgi:hypothetical protein
MTLKSFVLSRLVTIIVIVVFRAQTLAAAQRSPQLADNWELPPSAEEVAHAWPKSFLSSKKDSSYERLTLLRRVVRQDIEFATLPDLDLRCHEQCQV